MAFEDQLKIVAEAVGFTEATKAVDALALARQKLAEADARASTARTTGTVGDLGLAMQEQARAADAVRLLGGETGNAGQNAEDAAQSFKQLVDIVRLADPRLGTLLSQLGRVSRGAGDLAVKNIDLAATFASVTTFVRTNANALLLLGATGAVIAGIAAVTSALARQREELKKVNEEMDRRSKANDAFLGENDARRAAIENISDRRREGGLTPDQAREAEATARMIRENYPQLEEDAVNQAAGGLAGSGLSASDVAQAAFLLQTGRLSFRERDSAATRLGRFRRAQSRGSAATEAFFSREDTQGDEDASAFIAALAGGDDASLRRGIERFGRPMDPESVDKLIPFLRANPTIEALQRKLATTPEGARRDEEGAQLAAEALPILQAVQQRERRRQAAAEIEKAEATRRLEEEAQRELMERSQGPDRSILPGDLPDPEWERRNRETRDQAQRTMEQIERERANRGASVIEINHYNSRFVGPGAAAQAAAIRNGRTFERDAGERIV